MEFKGTKYTDDEVEFFKSNIIKKDVGLSKVLIKLLNGNLKYIQETDIYFLWDDALLLWIQYTKRDALLMPLSDLLEPLINYFMGEALIKYSEFKETLKIKEKKLKKLESINDKTKQNKLDIRMFKIQIKEDIDNDENLKTLKKLEGIKDSILQKSTLDNILRVLTKEIIDNNFIDNINSIHKNLLPINKGLVIDFKTLKTRKRTKEDLFSCECPVNFLGKKFKSIYGKRFIYSMFNNEKEQAEYFKKLTGYFLTGETEAKLFSVLLGTEGNNSKSSYINIMSKILGNVFSGSVHKSVIFESKSQSSHDTYEIALLKKRFVNYSETTNDNIIKPEVIKKVSGGDGMELRNIYKGSNGSIKYFNYKLLIATNTLFDFKDKTENTEALMKRLHYIPLMVSFHENPDKIVRKKKDFFYEKADPTFIYNLENDQDYIDDFFTYISMGAYEWYNQIDENKKRIIEIVQPNKIIEAKESFIRSLDKVYIFLDTYYTTDLNYDIKNIGDNFTLRSGIANHYKKYCDENGYEFIKSKFFIDLEKKGYKTYMGSGLKDKYKDYNGQQLLYGLKQIETEDEKKKKEDNEKQEKMKNKFKTDKK